MDAAKKATVPDSLANATSAADANCESSSNSWPNSLDDETDNACGSSQNAQITTLQQQQQQAQQQQEKTLSVAANTNEMARSSAFTVTATAAASAAAVSMGQSSEVESATCSGGGPAIKRIRRTNHLQRNFASTTPVAAAVCPAVEANSGPTVKLCDSSPSLEYFLQIQRLYQTSLLNNMLMSNPQLLMRLQQLNALQQAFSAQSLLCLQQTLLTGDAVGTHDLAQYSLKTSPSVRVTPQTEAADFAPLNALLAPVAQNQPPLSLLNSLIRQINTDGEKQLQQQATTVNTSNGGTVRPPLEQPTSAFSGLSASLGNGMPPSSNNEPWNPTSVDANSFYNLLVQQQYAAAAAIAATKQTAATASTLPVVVNGQDNNEMPSTTATTARILTNNATGPVPAKLMPTGSNGSGKSGSQICTRRLQQIPICRRALEARFARILAQELEASDEEHDMRSKGKTQDDKSGDSADVSLSDVERKASDSVRTNVAKACGSDSAGPIDNRKPDADDCMEDNNVVAVTLQSECPSALSLSSPSDVARSDAAQQSETAPTLLALTS
ncbi:unnamed protein product [Toxocara canis]|uniref:POU domain protein n=1 Tax=Toxocara canis TaxID=6265 RepID=A0A183UCJ3_TOXCA|nr:unnamed protein product [Toxocara canis]